MKNSRLLLLLLCLVASLRCALVHAETSPPDCGTDTACLSLFEQAQDQSKSGNLAEAQRLYRLAYDVKPDPALLYSIARVLHKRGQTKEAVSYYHRFIDSGIDDEVQKQKARDYLAELTPAAPGPRASNARRSASSPELVQSAPMPPITQATSTGKPIYKKWWFWTLIGGVTVAAVTGLAIGFSSQPQRPTLPAGYDLYTRTF